MQASIVEDDDERRRLWGLADQVFPAFENYRREPTESGARSRSSSYDPGDTTEPHRPVAPQWSPITGTRR